MKTLIYILLGLLLAISLVAAQSEDAAFAGDVDETNRHVPTCPRGCNDLCHVRDNDCKCFNYDKCDDVKLDVRVVGSWVDGRDGKYYAQYEYTIKNYSKRDILDIYLRSTRPLRVRNHDIWNIVRLPNNYLTLPYYQTSINAHASYTFGFILQGYERPNINIVYIRY